MKKVISLSICAAISIFIFSKAFSVASQPLKGSVNSFENTHVLHWKDFCPPQYLKVKSIEAKKPNLAVNILLGATIIGLPTVFERNSQYAEIAATNYWANRRNTFYKELKSCKENKINTMACYAKIRKNEEKMTAEYNKEQLLKAQKAEMRAQVTTEILNELGTAFAQALQEEVQRQITNKLLNNTNTTTTYSNDFSTTTNSEDQTNSQTCHNRCSAERARCRQGVMSTPSFGNDISGIRAKHLCNCEDNFVKCVSHCSCH